MSIALCSMSTLSQSKPWCAIISAASGLPVASQVPTDGVPSRILCLTTLGRMRAPRGGRDRVRTACGPGGGVRIVRRPEPGGRRR